VTYGALRLYRTRRVAADPVPPTRFELTIGRAVELRTSGYAVRTYALESILRFRGVPRLSVELGDGHVEALPVRVMPDDHVALAARADELLRAAKAAGGGYR
jgi:hypothetical protein